MLALPGALCLVCSDRAVAVCCGDTQFIDIHRDITDSLKNDKKAWEWGIMGGLLFSTVEGDNTEEHTYIPDFNAGLYATTDIFPPLGFRLEFYYAGLGAGFAGVTDSKLHFNYLVLPALLTYQFAPDFTLGVGPYFGYLINARDHGDDYDEDITDLLARLDIGAKIGVYFQISPVVNLSVSFQRGFINTQSGERVSTLKQYNQCVMFTTSFNVTRIIDR